MPFLALGAELGLGFGLLAALALPGLTSTCRPRFHSSSACALFTAIVRAPLPAAIVLVPR